MGTLLFLLIVLGLGYRATTPEQRTELARSALAAIRQARDAATRERDPFRDALLARTPRVLVTPALVALNATIFVFMLVGAGALADPQTLVGWGGSVGPRTTNGEWWRLVTMMFVHSGMFQLLINTAALVQLGVILERLVGRLAFAAAYFAAGIFAGLASLSAYPVAVSVGPSGAIFGLYGLLLASSICGVINGSSVIITPRTAKRLGPVAAVFILYSVTAGGIESAAVGFAVGGAFGLALTIGVGDRTPDARRLGATMGAAVAIAVAAAFPLRGIADVRPEIERVVALEDRTASAYNTAADRFKNGRISAETLAQLIDRTIVPELSAAEARLKGLAKVPPDHQPLVADAEEFLRLRHESWRLRADGLRRTNKVAGRDTARTAGLSNASSRLRAEAQYRADMIILGNAEGAERASLEAFQKIKPPDQKVTDQK
jgi:rhomboid protease GluP